MAAVAAPAFTLEETEALLRARLLTDERHLKSAGGKLLPITGQLVEPSPSPSPDELALHASRYATALDTVYLQLNKGKARAVHDAAEQDAAAYEQGIARIEAERQRTEEDIERLRGELGEAQTRRRNKIQYDALAKEIGKVASRTDSHGNIERLANDIATLLQEQSTYTETWSARKARFDEIVASLESLTGAIRAENEEAARKRALDQEDEDEEGEASRGDGKALDPTAPAFQPGAARVDDDAGGTMDVDGVATVPPNDAMEEKEEGEA